jgi:hypothetical protein
MKAGKVVNSRDMLFKKSRESGISKQEASNCLFCSSVEAQ